MKNSNQPKKQPKISQALLISAFNESEKDTYYFIEEYNCWAVFNGKKWELDAYHLLYEKLFNTLCKTYPNGSSNDDLLIKRSISILQNISEYRQSSIIFDTHPELFNCQNGVYNLETGEFIEHKDNQTRNLYLTKISNVIYNPDAKCSRFIQFLEEIFAKYDDVKGIIDYIQATYGYLISGYTQNQSFYFYHGAGANGKTTFIEALKHVIGEYSITFSKTLLTDRRAKISGKVYRELKGSRIVNINEFESRDVINESILKQLTGSDTLRIEVSANKVVEDKLPTKFIGVTNNLPKAKDAGHSLFRRVQIWVFNRIFSNVEIDRTLISQLIAEKDGIFNWLAEGYTKFCRKKNNQMHKEFLAESIPLKLQFMNANDCTASKIIYPDLNYLLSAQALKEYIWNLKSQGGLDLELLNEDKDIKKIGEVLAKLADNTIEFRKNKLYTGIGLANYYINAKYETCVPVNLHIGDINFSEMLSDSHIDVYIECFKRQVETSIDEDRAIACKWLEKLKEYRENLIKSGFYEPYYK